MKIIPIESLSGNYKNIFVSLLRKEIKPIVCPDGFERVLLGKNLKVSCCRSLNSYPFSDYFGNALDHGLHPSKYGFEDLLIIIQQQPDGHILFGWCN